MGEAVSASCADSPLRHASHATSPAFGEGGPEPQKRRRRPLLSQGRRDTMVVRQFVHRASALRPCDLATFRPDQGRARTTPSGEAEPGASWFGVRTTLGHHIPLSCVRAAETTLVSGCIPSRGPQRFWIPPGRATCPAGARPHFPVLVLLPCLQRPSNRAYQWGHPVARPATVSSLNTLRMTEMPAA